MFEDFTFSAPGAMNSPSSGGTVSPTNTDYVEAVNHATTPSHSTPPAINELVLKLRSHNLNSPLLTDQSMYEVQTCSPNRTTFLPSPIEDASGKVSPFYHSLPNIDPSPNDRPTTPPNRDYEMMHPNLLSCFQPQSADSYSRRIQRQILQEHQCRSTFTRDLQQLLEEMIETGDQCKLAETTGTMSSPPPSRGRDCGCYTSFMGTLVSCRGHQYEDEGLCESDENSISSSSALRKPSMMSSTLACRSSTTSLHSRRIASEGRRSSRHRRVASEGNIEIDFDTNDNITGGEISLRRAGAPAGVVKMGRLRGRGDSNIQPYTGWRKNVTRFRKSRRDRLTSNAT